MQPLHYNLTMPTLARLPTVSIAMYAADHPPPHFHVRANDGREALVEIDSLAVLAGGVSKREMVAALVWARANHEFLRAKWKELNP